MGWQCSLRGFCCAGHANKDRYTMGNANQLVISLLNGQQNEIPEASVRAGQARGRSSVKTQLLVNHSHTNMWGHFYHWTSTEGRNKILGAGTLEEFRRTVKV